MLLLECRVRGIAWGRKGRGIALKGGGVNGGGVIHDGGVVRGGVVEGGVGDGNAKYCTGIG